MTFFEGWKTLNACFDKGNFTALTQLVGYKLLAIDNERNHPESFLLTDRELMARTGIQSGSTIVEARRQLKNAGLIDFKTKKRHPTEYRFTVGNNRAIIEQKPSKKRAKDGDSYIRVREDFKTKDNLSMVGASEDLDKLIDYWEELHGGRLSFEHQTRLSALLKDHGADWVKAAMKEASDSNCNARGLMPKFLFGVIKRKQTQAEPKEQTPAKKTTPLNDYETLRRRMLAD